MCWPFRIRWLDSRGLLRPGLAIEDRPSSASRSRSNRTHVDVELEVKQESILGQDAQVGTRLDLQMSFVGAKPVDDGSER
jgi:hypothetical protein